MPYSFFTIPIRHATEQEDELNSFLASHRVLAVERQWLSQGENSCWCLCVDYLDTPSAGRRVGNRSQRKEVDYREVLSPEDFSMFSKLRDLRKQIAQAEAVPVYMVFTNEQLAQMVQQQVKTASDLEKLVGVGDARVKKYGTQLLEFLRSQRNGSAATP